MRRMIIKRVRPTLTDRQLYKNGRQSSMKQVYTNTIDKNKKEPVQNAILKKELAKIAEVKKIEEEQKINKEEKNTVVMDTKEKVELASAVLANESSTVKAKRLKKDKGLIERKENTIILTEDNRELLKD